VHVSGIHLNGDVPCNGRLIGKQRCNLEVECATLNGNFDQQLTVLRFLDPGRQWAPITLQQGVPSNAVVVRQIERIADLDEHEAAADQGFDNEPVSG